MNEAPAYGQVRESTNTPSYRFLVLAPDPELDVWSVLLMPMWSKPEITVHGTRFIRLGTRVVERLV